MEPLESQVQVRLTLKPVFSTLWCPVSLCGLVVMGWPFSPAPGLCTQAWAKCPPRAPGVVREEAMLAQVWLEHAQQSSLPQGTPASYGSRDICVTVS